ncbi:calcium-binding protein [Reinekea sp.]|uniref:calcium-binding protein n=1 Tax=Reinekea sp. TaxID=1970455 RepID=UPI0039C2A697
MYNKHPCGVPGCDIALAPASSYTDTLRSEDANFNELRFGRDDADLLITVVGTDDQIAVANWFNSSV